MLASIAGASQRYLTQTLSLDIRLIIFDLLVVQACTLELRTAKNDMLALVKTCWQLHNEIYDWYIARGSFDIPSQLFDPWKILSYHPRIGVFVPSSTTLLCRYQDRLMAQTLRGHVDFERLLVGAQNATLAGRLQHLAIQFQTSITENNLFCRFLMTLKNLKSIEVRYSHPDVRIISASMFRVYIYGALRYRPKGVVLMQGGGIFSERNTIDIGWKTLNIPSLSIIGKEKQILNVWYCDRCGNSIDRYHKHGFLKFVFETREKDIPAEDENLIQKLISSLALAPKSDSEPAEYLEE